MGPVYSIAAILGHFVLLAIDLGILFLVIRFVVQRSRVGILVGLDQVGRPVVAAITREVERLHKVLWPSTVLDAHRALILALCGLGLLRLLLSGFLAGLK